MLKNVTAICTVLLLVVPAAASDTAASHYQAGQTAYAAGDYQTAVSEYQAALSLKPSSAPAKDGLIKALTARLKELQGKVTQLEKALAEVPRARNNAAQDNVKRTEIRITGSPQRPSNPDRAPVPAARPSSDFPPGLMVKQAVTGAVYDNIDRHGNGNYTKMVVGRKVWASIQNRGKITYRSIIIYFSLYNRQKVQVDSGKLRIEQIGPGETATVSAYVDDKTGATTAKVVRIEAVPVQ